MQDAVIERIRMEYSLNAEDAPFYQENEDTEAAALHTADSDPGNSSAVELEVDENDISDLRPFLNFFPLCSIVAFS